ncbi:MAG: hypothetical protein H0W06_10270, partial [Chloroflexia bacterium]|nr:hypothetical protein [Chloroflexia bacterium]
MTSQREPEDRRTGEDAAPEEEPTAVVKSDTTKTPMPARELLRQDAGDLDADQVTMERSGAESIKAQRVSMDRSGAKVLETR